MPSDPEDPRNRIVRAKDCPNRLTEDHTCGSCAWGFYTKTGVGAGESADTHSLTPLNAGYKSQCGRVKLFADEEGRVGAVRGGRFFPGIPGNEAYELYTAKHPELLARAARASA